MNAVCLSLLSLSFYISLALPFPARAAQETTADGIAPPARLQVSGLPPISADLQTSAARFLEFRSASFMGWHPRERQILISTRFGSVSQLHHVAFPGGDRRQLTFHREPVAGGIWEPVNGNFLLFSSDIGGAENYQIFRQDSDGRVTMLTEGRSRNTGLRWNRAGKEFAFASTARTGKDTDIWQMNPLDPKSARLLLERQGGGWGVSGWSPDGRFLLLSQTISAAENRVHLLEISTGQVRQVLPLPNGTAAIHRSARFLPTGKEITVVTDRSGEFSVLEVCDLDGKALRRLSPDVPWDVEEYEVREDGSLTAVVTNEAGFSKLHIIRTADGTPTALPKLPEGVIGEIAWHRTLPELAFSLSGAQVPMDVFSWSHDTPSELHRWTSSEIGGMNPDVFAKAQLLRWKSFDGREITAVCHPADAASHPGPRPVVISIHGGPEGQSRPGFQGRMNFLTKELGITVIQPNVRGSSGYGKTFLALDNGRKREDSVKDIGTLLDFIATQPHMDQKRVAVMGGSYGGYMTLASLVHFGPRLRCGIDSVGISNFLSFLKNTQDYRRDLRRVEYGDEREPGMAEFFQSISPLTHVDRMVRPLMVVQGKNDPRVPVGEADQIVKAVAAKGLPVAYLLAEDEGHGFRKKENADFLFLAQIRFLQEHLLPPVTTGK